MRSATTASCSRPQRGGRFASPRGTIVRPANTSANAIGDHSVVVETTDGREIRITAWYDRARNRYVSEYERRSVVKSGGHDFRVWAQTPAYKPCTADDAASCLEAAVLEVDRVNIY